MENLNAIMTLQVERRRAWLELLKERDETQGRPLDRLVQTLAEVGNVA